MTTITETFLDARGNPIAGQTVVIETVSAPAVIEGEGLVGKTRITLTTNTDGEISVVVHPGEYRMTWNVGTQRSEWTFTVPADGGPYEIGDLGEGSFVAVRVQVVWFNDIQDMLTSDSRSWREGRTLNSYGSDGQISCWDCVPLTEDATNYITANSDSRMLTQDGLAICLRKSIVG